MSRKARMIPLCQLKPSKANVRRTDRLADIQAMASNIADKDLLENLLVKDMPQSNGRDTMFEVVAGGRRLAALKLLAKRKKIARDHPVRCIVLNKDDSAVELSLAENLMRAPLHPADQFEAFAALVREGLSVEEVAARFTVTPTFVQQRLKLASVSPKLIAEYRAGAMALDQLTAFTLSDNHALQEEIWFERGFAEMPAHTIRRLLTASQVSGSDARVKLVGREAYEAAGGTIVRDLFDAEDEGYFTDSHLLDRLVFEKLNEASDAVRQEGWQWVEIHADADLAELAHYRRAERQEVDLSEEECARLSALGERYDELVATLDDGDDSASGELDQVAAEIQQLESKGLIWPESAKARAGAIVTLDDEGSIEIIRGLLKPGANGKDKPQPDTAKKEKSGSNGYSEALLFDLSAHRTAAMRALLTQQPETALLALLHALVGRLFYPGESPSCLQVVATEVSLDRASASVGRSKAAESWNSQHEMWRTKLPELAQLWDWLCELDAGERLKLLAHCVSVTINALDHSGSGSKAAKVLAEELKLDMRDWWHATRENFLGRVTKNDILTAVSEGVRNKRPGGSPV